MHGTGNDFVVLDGFSQTLTLDSARITALADRRYGVGCDQVLVLEPGAQDGADARYRIFNADGGEVEQCGNGARCAADYLLRAGRARGTTIRLQSRAGLLAVDAVGPGEYRVNMGVPAFEPAQIPLRRPQRAANYSIDLAGGALEFAALSIGNPHAVIVVPDVDRAPVAAVGAALQASADFPNSVNVGFMQVCAPDRIRLRVFERGAGETLACGSGACAAVVTGRQMHGLGAAVRAELKGGALLIEWQGEGQPVWLTGPAIRVFEGSIDL
ncbi:MAG: diaminopimelate epimerase [Gammaproteobacteria bacterium]|nr:diaminopimelate epimerase [Gammaproteobacteria bacterium]